MYVRRGQLYRIGVAATQSRCVQEQRGSSACAARALTTTTTTSHQRSNGNTTEGYGPHSVTVRPRRATTAAEHDLVSCMALASNAHLRRSLAGLSHPTQQCALVFRSPAWRLSMVRLYRTIWRLHNKTVTVSLQTSVRSGAATAVSAVTGVAPRAPATTSSSSSSGRGNDDTTSASSRGESHHHDDDDTATAPATANTTTATTTTTTNDASDYLQRYLLTDEQRVFGNRFVRSEFANHSDADERAATAFYAGWYSYVLQLASGVTARDLSAAEVRLLTDEQQERLRQLHRSCVALHEQATTSPYNAPPI